MILSVIVDVLIFWVFFVLFIKCDFCLSCVHLFMMWSINRNWNLNLCICVYLKTSFIGKLESASHTWQLLFLTDTVLTTLPKIHFAYYFINVYYLEIHRVLPESNRIFCEFSIEILLLYHCIFAICLLLSWFCFCCGVLNSYMWNWLLSLFMQSAG